MYIPTIFFGSQGGCVSVDISGSLLPLGVSVGQLASGSESYFYIRVDDGSQVYFDIASGLTSQAKLILIGGGGSVIPYEINPSNPSEDSNTGGAGAGQVIQKEVSLQPGRYFMSCSYNLTTGSGGDAVFRTDSSNSAEWYVEKALGGQTNDTFNGGDNVSYSGGTGLGGSQGAGGGGAGSAGNGTDATQSGGSGYGGNGGSGSIIYAPFDSIVGYSVVAAGGAGDSYAGFEGFAPASDALGSGASGEGNQYNSGQPGAAFLFIPQTGCLYSGSGVTIPDETFFAEGGTTGTFVSGSITYKYHNFSAPAGRTQLFKVRRGFTNEAKVIQIAAGAGSSTTQSGSVASLWGGGAGAGGLTISNNVSLAGLNNLITIGDGGPAERNGNNTIIDAADTNFVFVETIGGGAGATTQGSPTSTTGSQVGGSGGGGDDSSAGGVGAAGIAGQGYAGGNAYQGAGISGGGGGGGATGVGGSTTGSFDTAAGGPGYQLTGIWSYLTASLFTSNPYIGKGGGGSIGNSAFTQGRKLNDNQPFDGSGADPFDGVSGSAGFLSIVYPISGSTSNSPG
jgi:hypothetical protein